MFSNLAARALGLLIALGLSTGIAYACLYADMEGTFDSGRDEVDAPVGGKPTPTPPAAWDAGESEASTAYIWGDEWVGFIDRPTVCNGVLKTQGKAKNGAVVSYDATDVLPFVLYREADMKPGFFGSFGAGGYADVIAGFIEPPPAGWEYHLEQPETVATVLRTPPSGFELVADWPEWAPEPEKTTFAVWGFRPGTGMDNIRLVNVETCEGD